MLYGEWWKMSISGGEIGLDEGGIAQAISDMIGHFFERPVWKQEAENIKYNKKGLVTKKWTTTHDISMGEILVPLVIAGFIKLNPLLSHSFLDAAGNVTDYLNVGGIPNLARYSDVYGTLLGPFLYARAIAAATLKAKDDADKVDDGEQTMLPGTEYYIKEIDPVTGLPYVKEGRIVNPTPKPVEYVEDSDDIRTDPVARDTKADRLRETAKLTRTNAYKLFDDGHITREQLMILLAQAKRMEEQADQLEDR